MSMTDENHPFTPSPITVGGAPFERGCYVDGHRGQYGPRRVVEIAEEILGVDTWSTQWPTDSDGSEIGAYGIMGSPWAGILGDDTVDEVVDLSDAAESALNAATEGGYWEWCDGEFFLSPFCAACDEPEEDHEQ